MSHLFTANIKALDFFFLSQKHFQIKCRCLVVQLQMRIWSSRFLTTQTMCHVENGNRILLANEMCVKRHPPKSWALQQLSLAASHSEAFYSLWISVKSLSSHTALCSPPLFSTLGGHFSSNSVKERSQLNSTVSVCFIICVVCLKLQ